MDSSSDSSAVALDGAGPDGRCRWVDGGGHEWLIARQGGSLIVERPDTGESVVVRFPDLDASIDPATGQVFLRAERSGGGDGRVYVVKVAVGDACGNVSTCEAAVGVPKSKKPGSEAVDSGQAYDATDCGAAFVREAGAATTRAESPAARSQSPREERGRKSRAK